MKFRWFSSLADAWGLIPNFNYYRKKTGNWILTGKINAAQKFCAEFSKKLDMKTKQLIVHWRAVLRWNSFPINLPWIQIVNKIPMDLNRLISAIERFMVWLLLNVRLQHCCYCKMNIILIVSILYQFDLWVSYCKLLICLSSETLTRE